MKLHIGNDSIRTQIDGTYRAVRQGAWWVGDYATVEEAKCALALKDADGKYVIKGISDGGDWASDEYITAKQMELGDDSIFGGRTRVQPANVAIRDIIRRKLDGTLSTTPYCLLSAADRSAHDTAANEQLLAADNPA